MYFPSSFCTRVDDYLCIWLSIMQKWKNILGSRKKGAQEPHAAREPRYDYQGNTTSNLKGISLDRLTLPVGITSYSLCPLFNPSSICGFLSDGVEHVRLRSVSVFVSLQRVHSLHRMSPGVWETSPSIWTHKATPCSCRSSMSRQVNG